jgi:hypothetical protein
MTDIPVDSLLPCPFCGSVVTGPNKIGGSDERSGYNFKMVVCCPCGVSISASSHEGQGGWCDDNGQAAAQVVALWNRRLPATARGSPWIACAAQMPTTWAKCLVWDGHDVFQATYQLKDGGLDGRKAGLWYDVCDGLDLVGITHWMLQPEGLK